MALLKKIGRKLPGYRYLANAYNRRKKFQMLKREAQILKEKCDSCESIEDKADLIISSKYFTSNQVKEEICGLARKLIQIRPKYICEIGTQKGGTLVFFSFLADPQAILVSIDLSYPTDEYQMVLKNLLGPMQRLYCINKDSHSIETLNEVMKRLKGNPSDFLFIDGDHTLEGVSKDYELYGPLVKSGGIIAFHDIVPDHSIRYGTKTMNSTGEVPVFWSQVREKQENTIEFIKDPDQDGYGIGVIMK